MATRAGRPPRPTSIDSQLLMAAHRALLAMGKELGLTTAAHRDPSTGRTRRRPRPLDLAVLALEAQEALEVLAAQEVAMAREQEGLTWQQVGEAFDISTQSAHHRFASK